MMDFDGKEQVLEDVQKNGGLFQQVQQLQATMMKMAAVLDAQNGTGITANMGQAIQNGEQAQPGKADSRHKVTTDSIGNVAAGNSLAVQAQRRAQNNANRTAGRMRRDPRGMAAPRGRQPDADAGRGARGSRGLRAGCGMRCHQHGHGDAGNEPAGVRLPVRRAPGALRCMR